MKNNEFSVKENNKENKNNENKNKKEDTKETIKFCGKILNTLIIKTLYNSF